MHTQIPNLPLIVLFFRLKNHIDYYIILIPIHRLVDEIEEPISIYFWLFSIWTFKSFFSYSLPCYAHIVFLITRAINIRQDSLLFIFFFGKMQCQYSLQEACSGYIAINKSWRFDWYFFNLFIGDGWNKYTIKLITSCYSEKQNSRCNSV